MNNLITSSWLPVVRQNGQPDIIAPWQIAETKNPVMTINAPRADFQGALYQLLIGLLQTAFAPEDEYEWEDYWQQPPETAALKASFDTLTFAFELNNPDGIAFLQDYDLPDCEAKSISALFIDAPGEQTIKNNADHFIKRNGINQLCPSCTATALFTLQTNAPSGGAGYRVGLRGGGPLTSLIIPKHSSSTLWQTLWLNVLNQEDLPPANDLNAAVLPWLGQTRISDKAQLTTPNEVHPLHCYWGMPRRIRLISKTEQGHCDICGAFSETLYSEYKTKKHGTNYGGAWLHPLTPYRLDPKHEKEPLSLKGQQGGLTYRHWLGLALKDENGDTAATIVSFYNSTRGRKIEDRTASLWCFGYDMDNMKARCWYESRFPVYYLDAQQQENLMAWAGELINSAKEVVSMLRSQVKEAWFDRPKDAKGDISQIDAQFWQSTEADFYLLLEKMACLPSDTRQLPSEFYKTWLDTLRIHVFDLFDSLTLTAVPEDLDLKRIVKARNFLLGKFWSNKLIKILKEKATHQENES